MDTKINTTAGAAVKLKNKIMESKQDQTADDAQNKMGLCRRYYVVWVGVKPGIYTTWAEAEQQVKGFSGARHKSFYTLEDAEAAYGNPPADISSASEKKCNQ